MTELFCQKEKFDLPEGHTYLNCAYMSPIPKAAELVGVAALRKKSRPWEITTPDFFEPGKKVQELFARLINSSEPERVAVISSVSHGMASVAKNLHPEPGQNIVMLEEQFPSNYYSWKRLADESGASLRIVSPPEMLDGRGKKWNEKLLESIDNQTVAVALPHVHWADGTRIDLEAMRQKCDGTGAKLIIDGTQSVGAMPFDVAAVRPDALICGGYKWLFGPYSVGLAYFGEAFDGGVPIEENWINRKDSDNFQGLVKYQPEYGPGAERFSMGERSQFVALAMLIETLQLILEWKPGRIQSYCEKISAGSLRRLAEMGVWSERPDYRGKHLIGLRLPEALPMDLLKRKAAEENIFVSFRGNALRVAPNVYNTEEDFGKLERAIGYCLANA